GQFASALDDDMQYKIWPTTGGEPIYTAESGWVIVGLNADASLAVLKKDQDPTARLVDTNTNRLVAELDVGPWLPFATFSPDGRYLIGSTDETPDAFRVFDTSDGSLVAQFGGETNEYAGLWVRFVPTGDTVVVTTPRGDVIIFDFLAILNGAATEDAITRIINAHDSFVFEPAISPDGTMLATNAQGEPARVWDIATGRFLDEVGTGGSKAVAFDPIKPWLYVGEGNTITAHTLDIDALVALGRSTLTRDMTAEECQQYLHGHCDS
ncbi:MAG: WD40 repeat domain-containing protein, partial [Acidimicrobiia bacterium]